MKSKLYFAVDICFDVTVNEQLKELSALKIWDTGLKKYLYVFPANELDKVIRLTGRDINFEDEVPNILNIIQHSPTLSKKIDVEKYKGHGFVNILRFPKLFIIKTVMRKQPQEFKIPLETVKACWRAVKKGPIRKLVKSKLLAEKWCKEMGITRYNRQSGLFDGDKMYGDRITYFKYYYSLKVLEDFGLISYSKAGYVTRLKDKWEYQGEII